MPRRILPASDDSSFRFTKPLLGTRARGSQAFDERIGRRTPELRKLNWHLLHQPLREARAHVRRVSHKIVQRPEHLLHSDKQFQINIHDAKCEGSASMRSLSYPPNSGENARNPWCCQHCQSRRPDTRHREQPLQTDHRRSRFRLPQISVCSEISSASSTSMPRYLPSRGAAGAIGASVRTQSEAVVRLASNVQVTGSCRL